MSVQPEAVKVRWWWIALALLSVVEFVWAMQYQSAVWNDARAHGDPLGPMQPYWLVFGLSWLTLGLLMFQAGRQTWRQSGRISVWMVLLGALAARVAVVLSAQPVLSDDIWRYIHDGAVLGGGASPYVDAPDGWSADQQPVPQIVDRINNPGLVTIYQPTSQYVFAAIDRVWRVCPEALQRLDPDHNKVFRLGFVLFDMVLIGLLLWQLRRMKRSAWWAAGYAWHPLAISEVAGAGHQDVVGISLLLLSLVLTEIVHREERSRRASWFAIGAGVAFGLALGVKPIVLPIALILAWVLRRQPGRVVTAAVATVLTVGAIYLPFVLMDGGLTGMADTARLFMDKWAFNGSAYDLALHWAYEKQTIDMLAAGALLTVIVVSLTRSKGDVARSAGAFLFASLLVSSTVHPWYLLWALALLPLCFNLPMWVFSLTIAASYVAHINPEGYRVPQTVVIGEYLPVYALLTWSGWRWVRLRSIPLVSSGK